MDTIGIVPVNLIIDIKDSGSSQDEVYNFLKENFINIITNNNLLDSAFSEAMVNAGIINVHIINCDIAMSIGLDKILHLGSVTFI
jgi:hypothetical protein